MLGVSKKSEQCIRKRINETRVAVKEWFLSNRLILNSKKTQSTIFSLREVSGDRLDSVRFFWGEFGRKATLGAPGCEGV